MELEKEIKQEHFRSLYLRGMLNIIYTGNWLMSKTYQMLKPFELSPQQYNVLRILRGMYPETSSLANIQERMMDRMSNSTRLVEKLLQKNHVTRNACFDNRRKVDIRITQQGLELLARIDREIEHIEQILEDRLDDQQIVELNKLCDRIRD